MNTSNVIGLEGGQNSTWFKVLGEEGRDKTKYYPAIVDGKEMQWSDFASLNDYLAHKVERERETIRFTVAGNAVVAEEAIARALGCKTLATSPTTVDAYPDQPLIDTTAAAAALGKMTSDAKAEAARINGKRGGRPRRKVVSALAYSDDGDTATVSFADGTVETRAADNLADLWFTDAATGKLVQWGEDGLYETENGWTRL